MKLWLIQELHISNPVFHKQQKPTFLFFFAIMENLDLSLIHLTSVHVSIKILFKPIEVLTDSML